MHRTRAEQSRWSVHLVKCTVCMVWPLFFLIRCLCCQVYTYISTPGLQQWLQATSKSVPGHGAEQFAPEHHGTHLCVREHQSLIPCLRERLRAAQGGAEQHWGKPLRAVQHHEWLHWGHHTWRSITGRHIAAGLWLSLTTAVDWRVVFTLGLTESCRSSICDMSVCAVSDWAADEWPMHVVQCDNNHKTNKTVPKQTQWSVWRTWRRELLFGYSQCSKKICH